MAKINNKDKTFIWFIFYYHSVNGGNNMDKTNSTNIIKNKSIIEIWYLDNCDQAATLLLQLHGEFFPCLLSIGAFSDSISAEIVLFNFSQNTLHCSRTRESLLEKDLSPSIAIKKLVSRVEKRLEPISLMLTSFLAVEDSPSAAKL